MSAANRFDEELHRFPPAGSGVHAHVMRLCNLAIIGGLPPDTALPQIRAAMPRAPSPPSELESTWSKAGATVHTAPGHRSSCGTYPRTHTTRTQADREHQAAELKAAAILAIRKLTGPDPLPLADLAESSPLPVGDIRDPVQQRHNAAHLLRTLHPDPAAVLFCGPRYGRLEYLATVEKWAERFTTHTPPPFWILNPLSGHAHQTKGGSMSHRCDAAVTSHRYALFEIDLPEIDLSTQAAFLRSRIASGWPVRAITYSGGKSLHAVFQVDCRDAEQWADIVQGQLFPMWQSLGADPQCRNPSRLSRIPGHIRDNGNLQSLLWLAPEGWRAPKQQDTPPENRKPPVTRVSASQTTADTNNSPLSPDARGSPSPVEAIQLRAETTPPDALDILKMFHLRLPPVEAFTAELSDLLNFTPRAAELALSRLTSLEQAHTFTDPGGIRRVAFAENFEGASPCQYPQNLRTAKEI